MARDQLPRCRCIQRGVSVPHCQWKRVYGHEEDDAARSNVVSVGCHSDCLKAAEDTAIRIIYEAEVAKDMKPWTRRITEAHMTTEERFEALEKALETSVRRQRITITALVLVAVAAAVMAAAPQTSADDAYYRADEAYDLAKKVASDLSTHKTYHD